MVGERTQMYSRRDNEKQILAAIEESLGQTEGKTPSMITELEQERDKTRRAILSGAALDRTINHSQAA